MSDATNRLSNCFFSSFSALKTPLLFLFLVNLFFSNTSIAQETNSPLSYHGIGEVGTEGTAVNAVSGGLGVANSNGIYINNLNPATIARNRYTVFEMGVNMESKAMQNSERRSNTFSGTLGPITLAFPMSPKWTMSLSLRPVSSVTYGTFSTHKLKITGEDSITTTYSGSGGLNHAVISNGYKVSKDMYIGIETGLLFGVINKDVTTQNLTDGQYYQIKLANHSNYSGFHWKVGYLWRPKVSKNYYLNIGATAELSQKVNVTKSIEFQTLSSSGITKYNADTLYRNPDLTTTLPSTYRFGIALERPGKLNVSLDYTMTNWNQFRDTEGKNDALSNSYKVAVGAEYIPKFDALNGYFNHVMYRAGASYSQTPYSYSNGAKLTDMNVSVGASFPLRNISYLNLAVVAGKRGTLATNGVEEQYTKIVVGFTLGDFYWFRKPKID